MDCMRQDYIPEQACLGSVPAGSVVMLPNDDDLYLVTDNVRIRQGISVVSGTVDTIGVVSCKTGALSWFADRHDVIPIKDATLVYRLVGMNEPKHD